MRGLEQAKYQAKRSLKSRLGEKETLNPAIIAKVGNGAGAVVVSGRPGWIYVRLHGDDNQLTEAKLGIPLDAASLNDAWVRVRRASARKASYYVVEEFITSSTGSSAPPMSAHPLDPDDGPHTGVLTEDDVAFDDAMGHDHQGSGATGKPANADRLQGRPLSSGSPADGQVYAWNATTQQWEPEDQAGGGAPTDASYVTTEAEAGLTNEKVLGSDIIMRGPAASKPAASVAGRIYIETDGSYIVWRDNGTSWDEIARGEAGMRLAQLVEKAHDSLTGVTADQHHEKFTPAQHDARDHSAVAATVALSELGSKAHSELTGVDPNQHHAQLHKSSHQNGGGDEINVAGLSGELADLQKVKDHTHQSSGGQGSKIDHGAALLGLGDDDHTQYLNVSRHDADDHSSLPAVACEAKKSGNQSIPNNTVTTLSFDQETYDTDGMHDNVTNNSRITCKRAGYYTIIFNLEFAANSAGRRSAVVRKNGTTDLWWVQYEPVSESGKTTIVVGARTIYMALNDYIELRAYQSSGGNLDVSAGQTYFSAIWQGA